MNQFLEKYGAPLAVSFVLLFGIVLVGITENDNYLAKIASILLLVAGFLYCEKYFTNKEKGKYKANIYVTLLFFCIAQIAVIQSIYLMDVFVELNPSYTLLWKQFISKTVTLERNMVYLTILVVVFALMTLWNKRKDIQKKIVASKEREEERLVEHKEMLMAKFPKLKKKKFTTRVLTHLSPRNLLYVMGFLVVVLIFVSIRSPHINNAFGGLYNSSKVVSYVPIAQEMYKAKNPFLFSNPAYTALYEKTTDQRYESFWRLPVLEWTLAPWLAFENVLPFEITIRTYLTFVGVIFLALFFAFISKLFDKRMALLATFFMALTSFFHVITWVTTADFWAIIFIMLALNLHIRKKERWAYIAVGLAVIIKISFGIIGLGLFGFLALAGREKMKQLVTFGFLAAVPYIGLQIFIRRIPANPDHILENSLRILLFVLLLIGSVYLTKRYTKTVQELLHKKRVKFAIAIGIIVIAGAVVYFGQSTFLKLAPKFLTDSELLFNPNLYKQLFSRIQFINLPILNFFFWPSIMILFFTKGIMRKYLLALASGSAVFMILASKSINFHWYYNHIFIITCITFIVGFIYLILYSIPKTKFRFAIYAGIFLLFVIIAIPSYSTPDRINLYRVDALARNMKYMSEYILERSTPEEKHLRLSSTYTMFYLYTGQPFRSLNGLEGEELEKIRRDIKEKGFYKAFTDLNFHYLVAWQGEVDDDDLINILYLFTDEVEPQAYDRTEIILSRLEGRSLEYKNKTQILYEKYDPQQYFEKEEIVDGITIFKIVPGKTE